MYLFQACIEQWLQCMVNHQSMRLLVSSLVDQGSLAMLPILDDRRSQRLVLIRPGLAEVKMQQAARASHLSELLATT